MWVVYLIVTFIYLFIYLCVIYLYLFIYLLEPFWFSRLFSICCFRVTAFIYLSISDLSICAVSELRHLFIYDLYLWIFMIDLQPSVQVIYFLFTILARPRIRTRIVARWRFNINHLTIQPRFIYFDLFRNIKKIYFYLKGVFSALL